MSKKEIIVEVENGAEKRAYAGMSIVSDTSPFPENEIILNDIYLKHRIRSAYYNTAEQQYVVYDLVTLTKVKDLLKQIPEKLQNIFYDCFYAAYEQIEKQQNE